MPPPRGKKGPRPPSPPLPDNLRRFKEKLMKLPMAFYDEFERGSHIHRLDYKTLEVPVKPRMKFAPFRKDLDPAVLRSLGLKTDSSSSDETRVDTSKPSVEESGGGHGSSEVTKNAIENPAGSPQEHAGSVTGSRDISGPEKQAGRTEGTLEIINAPLRELSISPEKKRTKVHAQMEFRDPWDVPKRGFGTYQYQPKKKAPKKKDVGVKPRGNRDIRDFGASKFAENIKKLPPSFFKEFEHANLEKIREEQRKEAAANTRKKGNRRHLVGYECKCCKGYYDSLELSPASRAKRVQAVSRHRAVVPPPKTPPRHYDYLLPSTPEMERLGMIGVLSPEKFRQIGKARKNIQREIGTTSTKENGRKSSKIEETNASADQDKARQIIEERELVSTCMASKTQDKISKKPSQLKDVEVVDLTTGSPEHEIVPETQLKENTPQKKDRMFDASFLDFFDSQVSPII